MVDRDDALPEISFVMMIVCWMMWRLCCRRQRRKRNHLQFTQSAGEGVW